MCFRAVGEVGLYKARIGSDFTCDGGIFLNPGGRALGAGGITVGGAIELRNGFEAMGVVGFYSARISGNLTCDGGHFLNAGKMANTSSKLKKPHREILYQIVDTERSPVGRQGSGREPEAASVMKPVHRIKLKPHEER